MSEPRITINGTELTEEQARTVRVAVNALALGLEAETFGKGKKGQAKWLTYQQTISEGRVRFSVFEAGLVHGFGLMKRSP